MQAKSSEELSCVGNTPDPHVPGTPRSNNLRAILCGVASLGEALGGQMNHEGFMPEDMLGEDMLGQSTDDHVGEEMRSNLTLGIADVNGATVLLTLTRTSYHPYVSTPRMIGRYLSSTWSWARGHKEPQAPPPDPHIERDVDLIRSIVGTFYWTGSARGDPSESVKDVGATTHGQKATEMTVGRFEA